MYKTSRVPLHTLETSHILGVQEDMSESSGNSPEQIETPKAIYNLNSLNLNAGFPW